MASSGGYPTAYRSAAKGYSTGFQGAYSPSTTGPSAPLPVPTSRDTGIRAPGYGGPHFEAVGGPQPLGPKTTAPIFEMSISADRSTMFDPYGAALKLLGRAAARAHPVGRFLDMASFFYAMYREMKPATDNSEWIELGPDYGEWTKINECPLFMVDPHLFFSHVTPGICLGLQAVTADPAPIPGARYATSWAADVGPYVKSREMFERPEGSTGTEWPDIDAPSRWLPGTPSAFPEPVPYDMIPERKESPALIEQTSSGYAPPGGGKPVKQSFHERRPPGRNEKHKKLVGTGVALRALARAWGGITEIGDLIDAIHGALPKHLQKTGGGKNADGSWKRSYAGELEAKLRNIYKNAAHLDAAKAVSNVVYNHFEDAAIGKSKAAYRDAVRNVTGSNSGVSLDRSFMSQHR